MLAGDTDAFRAIMEAYQAYLYRAVYPIVNDRKDAEDVLQEAFVKIFVSLPRYQHQGFKTWITRIAVNTAIDYRRKRSTRREQLSDSYEEQVQPVFENAAELEVVRKERGELIAKYVNDLPSNYREVVVAFYLEEKSYQQIADEQGVEIKTVASKLFRARSWMKKHWKEEDLR
ncbi:RNA polymerase sigma factor [Paenibacillus sp. MBLB4367]|uniref:RNA polymerase sigma factor n=1 Tax=Paenibacillus sp. MBLB4367 TaxID=3384767 RepID=UPI003907EC3C